MKWVFIFLFLIPLVSAESTFSDEPFFHIGSSPTVLSTVEEAGFSLVDTVLRILVGFIALSVLAVSLFLFLSFIKDNFKKLDFKTFFVYIITILIWLLLAIALINYITTVI